MTQRLHRRLLAASLVTGISTGIVALAPATTAQAATTVDVGSRETVQTRAVSPAALPVAFSTGTQRRTTTVTVTL
ncbi:hypothetical protein [Kineococcus rhizosphaerae]|uniref:Uncharacterized protein n=1 Tax=Kineococcus rhizosphaerae TaxID=559628 RepID=A0A2T0R9P4_9ACTN|nr:hypothetical protein [Kineococcus rhizosphaerae]PRY17889.1 hypothetical protein CLV37_101131 [Kineococcus rhizosphaerae]